MLLFIVCASCLLPDTVVFALAAIVVVGVYQRYDDDDDVYNFTLQEPLMSIMFR